MGAGDGRAASIVEWTRAAGLGTCVRAGVAARVGVVVGGTPWRFQIIGLLELSITLTGPGAGCKSAVARGNLVQESLGKAGAVARSGLKQGRRGRGGGTQDKPNQLNQRVKA